jgi:DNA-binding transcriptional ArsR family regulator
MVEKYINLDLEDPRSEKIALALSNQTSKKILTLLADKEMNATELANELKLPLNTVGYNLDNLVEAGLVEKAKTPLWSIKGKKIERYTLADKKIIISPKKMFGGIIPAVIISGLLAIGIKIFTSKSLVSKNLASIAQEAPKEIMRSTGDQLAQASQSYAPAAPLAKEAVIQVSNNADKIYAPLVTAGNEWLFFLLGALIALIIILTWNWKKI